MNLSMDFDMLKKVILFTIVATVIIIAGYFAIQYMKKGEEMEWYPSKYSVDTEENEKLGKYIKKVIHTVNYAGVDEDMMDWPERISYAWGIKKPDGSAVDLPSVFELPNKLYNKKSRPIETFSGGIDGGYYMRLNIPSPQEYKNIVNIEAYSLGRAYRGKAAYFCEQETMFSSKYILMDFNKYDFYLSGDSLRAIGTDGKPIHCRYEPLEPSNYVYTETEFMENDMIKVKHYQKLFQNITIPKALSDYGKVFIVDNTSLVSTKEGVHPSVGKGLWITSDGEHEMFYQSMDPSLYGVEDFVPVSGVPFNVCAGKDGRLLVRVF